MKGIVEERAIKLGEYIVENKYTVRKAAAKFGISKSTVHKDVTDRLKTINPWLYREVGRVLEQNKQERKIRSKEKKEAEELRKFERIIHPRASKGRTG